MSKVSLIIFLRCNNNNEEIVCNKQIAIERKRKKLRRKNEKEKIANEIQLFALGKSLF